MASPQLENGYTRISNEILEAITRTNLSGYESRALWHIIRSTYGYQVKSRQIPDRNFARATGIDRRHIQRALKRLAERQIIGVSKGANSGPGGATRYQFNKNYEEWKEGEKWAPNMAPTIIGASIDANNGASIDANNGRPNRRQPISLKKIKENIKESETEGIPTGLNENPPGPRKGPEDFLNPIEDTPYSPSKADFAAAKARIKKSTASAAVKEAQRAKNRRSKE